MTTHTASSSDALPKSILRVDADATARELLREVLVGYRLTFGCNAYEVKVVPCTVVSP